jgi:hypothetical protein
MKTETFHQHRLIRKKDSVKAEDMNTDVPKDENGEGERQGIISFLMRQKVVAL